ncbi:MAG TPA: DUF389 domain-containing protein [Novosphingobium sp.]|nr:DUF389 domain-containing protein [Novosphingobium sp.]
MTLTRPLLDRLGPARTELAQRLARLRTTVAHAVLLPDMAGDVGADLRGQVRTEGALTHGYVLMCVLSAGIAILGPLQSSTAVVIGAMLISPLMGPIASMGFGFSSFDGRWIRDAARVVAVGAGVGVLTAILLTWASPIRDATPEIIARTQPTLLDLAVALLSGVAGGYATVRQKGGTAIGVAIATALMPPLATVGYGIAVLQPAFALGAFLLFLTNLAAIAFAFAVVARLSGAARPRARVEWTRGYIAITVLAITALATPLGLTLQSIAGEARARTAVREAGVAIFGSHDGRIAQLNVRRPLFAATRIEVVVITPEYVPDARQRFARELETRLDEAIEFDLQQVLAADITAQTRALVNAAMERTRAGIAADVPPLDRIRESLGLPLRAVWTNRAERVVEIVPAEAPGWSLADYRRIETRATAAGDGWAVRISPPPVASLTVQVVAGEPIPGAVRTDLAVWAVKRWGMKAVRLPLAPGYLAEETGETPLIEALSREGIAVTRDAALPAPTRGVVTMAVLPPPPAPALPAPSPQ